MWIVWRCAREGFYKRLYKQLTRMQRFHPRLVLAMQVFFSFPYFPLRSFLWFAFHENLTRVFSSVCLSCQMVSWKASSRLRVMDIPPTTMHNWAIFGCNRDAPRQRVPRCSEAPTQRILQALENFHCLHLHNACATLEELWSTLRVWYCKFGFVKDNQKTCACHNLVKNYAKRC